MAKFLNVGGATIACQVAGSGPLMVFVHGIGQSRDAYRFMVPALVAAGCRVATVDMRGSGESSATWQSSTRTDIAGDLIALIERLGGPAVLVGHPISGGAATIVAARAPSLVIAVVELAPFTRKVEYSLGDLGVSRYRKAAPATAGVAMFGSHKQWRKYVEIAAPEPRRAGWAASLDRTNAMLHEPGRMKALQRQMNSAADAGAPTRQRALPGAGRHGTLDPDWGDPKAKGEAIAAKVVGLIQSFLGSVRA